MTPDPCREVILARKAPEGPSSDLSGRILALCPADLRPRYARLAEQAEAGRYRAAVKLKCIECAGWSYVEAKRCEIPTCALWAVSRRIFGRARESRSSDSSP
jgi:hypothetical protein